MNTRLYIYICFRVILMVLLGMLLTYVPDYLRDFFGDTPRNPGLHPFDIDSIDLYWNWGARHYWYFTGVVILFSLSLIDNCLHVVNKITRYYPKAFK